MALDVVDAAPGRRVRLREIEPSGLEILLHLRQHRDEAVGIVADPGEDRDRGGVGLPLEAA
jgi:hypothetical protein